VPRFDECIDGLPCQGSATVGTTNIPNGQGIVQPADLFCQGDLAGLWARVMYSNITNLSTVPNPSIFGSLDIFIHYLTVTCDPRMRRGRAET
jgi:hypothetical protein